jgi:hypothetical protein
LVFRRWSGIRIVFFDFHDPDAFLQDDIAGIGFDQSG